VYLSNRYILAFFSTKTKKKRFEMRQKKSKKISAKPTVLDDTRKMPVLSITLFLVPDPTSLSQSICARRGDF